MIRILRMLAVAALPLSILPSSVSAAPAASAKPAKPVAASGPRVVTTDPPYGAKSVNPATTVLRVTFSEPMQADQYSFTPITGRELPEWGAPVTLSEDKRTFSVPVTLRPGRKYGVWINAPGHAKFKNTAGKPALPYQLFFNAAETPVASEAAAAPTTAATLAPTPVPTVFRIFEPADGSEVRDRVTVSVPAATIPEGGFVTFFVDGRFIVGSAPAPNSEVLSFHWNTKDPLPGSEKVDARLVKDGAHVLLVHLHDASGQTTQTSQVRVNVRNTIRASEIAAEGVLLRYQFAENQDLEYLQRYSCEVTAPGSQKKQHKGEIHSSILFEEKLEQGSFALLGKFGKARVDDANLSSRDLAAKWGVGRSVRFELDPQGMMQLTSKKGRPLVEVVQQLVPFPNDKVKPGQSWESSVVLAEALKNRNVVTPAKHTLEGLEWQSGHECVRIRTDYRLTKLKDPEPSKYLILATGTTNIPKGGDVSVRGRRYTYFAYKIGRVVRVVDEKTITLTTPPVTPPMGMGMEPGMMGMPGMEPGMEPGMPGMEPGMMPGPRRPAAPKRVVYTIEATDTVEFVPPEEAGE